MNPKVDEFLNNAKRWPEEMGALRKIVLACGLTEELKWKQPCYTLNDSNVAMISAFKDYCIVSFLKGALLDNEFGLLHRVGENTQAARVMRFTSLAEIKEREDVIKNYLFDAIEIEKAGLKVEMKPKAAYEVPQELTDKLAANPTLKAAFEALTPGRQKGYLLHFSGAKQSKTRASRIDACTERILAGYGFRDCICGHSKRMPNCDGSHKYL